MTGKIILSMNVDDGPSREMIEDTIDTLAYYRDGIDVSPTSPRYGWILDSNGNVRAEWRYEND